MPVEEGEQQGPDVTAVHIRVGHDDHAVVANLVDLFLFLDPAAESGDEYHDLLRREHLVETSLLDIEDLPAQRKDRLILSVAPLLG